MKKYFFLSALILSFFIAFQGVSRAITVTASPSPATVNQPVTVTVNSSYSVFATTPSCTLAVDFGDGSPEAILTGCTTASCTRTTTHTYTTPGQYTITAHSLPDACLTPPTAPDPATASLTVRCAPLVISSPASLATGTLGAAYSYSLQATGGQPPYVWSLTSGALPPGLNLSASGAISGTPTASGNYNFTARVSDTCPTGAQSQTQAFTLTIGCPPIGITSPTALPAGTAGQTYNYQLQTTGGQAPVSFALTAGTLPSGLTLSASGLISGPPAAAGIYNFTVTATDSCAIQTQSAQKSFSMTVNPASCPALSITSPSILPAGTIDLPYSRQILTTGGQPPLTFSISSGALPPGLALSASGLLSGTPAAAGTFSFMIKADDSCPTTIQSQRQQFSITIGCLPLSITSSSVMPAASAGQPYSGQIQTSGGRPPLTFSISSGALPPGLALSTSGLLSGTPTAAGTYNFTIIAADSCPAGTQQVQRAFSLVVGGDLRVTTAPASLRIPRNMASTHHILYAFRNAPTTAMTLTSALGVFTANSRIIGETSAPLNVSLVNGTGTLTESLTIPPAITRRAEETGTSRIIYTRTFTSGALAVTAQTELIAGTEMTADFSINRLQLYFENQRAEITVDRNQPNLKAFADIRFSGSGLLNGYWEVDGRILEYVNQHLVYGTTLTLATPDVPPLPTFAPGTHMVRFVITAPSPDIPIPQAIYFVTSEESGQIRSVDLIFPEDQSELPYEALNFKWEPVNWAVTYLIVFTDKADEKPVFSAYTREGGYRLPDLILESLFLRGKSYQWQVKGYDGDGNVLGESGLYGFVFSE